MINPKQLRGFALAIVVIAILAACFYFLFGDPTDPENANFDDSGPRLVALSVLAFVFVASFIFGQPKIKEIVQGTLFWGDSVQCLWSAIPIGLTCCRLAIVF